jgi:hypothetical protein
MVKESMVCPMLSIYKVFNFFIAENGHAHLVAVLKMEYVAKVWQAVVGIPVA